MNAVVGLRWARHTVIGTLCVAIAVLPGMAWAKCPTARLIIDGPSLEQAVTIDDDAVLSRFNIWNGPRVRRNGKALHLDPGYQQGAFVDWPGGVVDMPTSGQRFSVSFFCADGDEKELLKMYEVDYAMTETSGYIYLPGRDDERFGPNVTSIVHSAEDNWFRATIAWERFIRPIIEKAMK